MSEERVVLAQIILPPSAEHCFAALCGQKACCTLEIRTDGNADLEDDEEEIYVLPLCHAHALHTLSAPLAEAARLFPPDEVDVPPWERDET